MLSLLLGKKKLLVKGIQCYIPSETVTHKIKIHVFLFWFHFHFIPDNITFYYIDTAEIPGFQTILHFII